MKLTSSGFKDGGMIPERYSRDGRNVSPPLAWDGVPKNTRSLALIVDDPDVPSGNFVHWLVYNIPADATQLGEGIPAAEKLPNGARQGRNDFGEIGYGGPQRAALTGISSTYTRSISKSRRRLARHESKSMTR